MYIHMQYASAHFTNTLLQFNIASEDCHRNSAFRKHQGDFPSHFNSIVPSGNFP